MLDPSSFANPTPLAHTDTSKDVLPRGGASQHLRSNRIDWFQAMELAKEIDFYDTSRGKSLKPLPSGLIRNNLVENASRRGKLMIEKTNAMCVTMVIVMDYFTPVCNWLSGRVIEVYHGSDGKVKSTVIYCWRRCNLYRVRPQVADREMPPLVFPLGGGGEIEYFLRTTGRSPISLRQWYLFSMMVLNLNFAHEAANTPNIRQAFFNTDERVSNELSLYFQEAAKLDIRKKIGKYNTLTESGSTIQNTVSVMTHFQRTPQLQTLIE
ncbi:hypothetical protein TNCV_5068171 [Trichonephila clavipes]|nr:hypothetical protein TNCV_5068171 [Trichonephila clavipes]